ncbi:uncharacterized protein BJ212DRAFT_1281884, partial [Suillus subaureus]
QRNPGQCTAHTIFTFKTKTAANQAIRFSLTIEGRKVFGRKLIQEPTCCLKCHAIRGNHMAADCPQELDMCRTCRVNNPELFFCINCQTNNHAAWSRDCPTFIRKWEVNQGQQEDAHYIYFPTNNPLTWDTHPGQNEPWQNNDQNQGQWNQPQAPIKQ